MDHTDHQHLPTVIAACAAITVFGFAFGLTYPLLSLILESRGVSSDMIGVNGAMMPIGILLISPLIPVLSKRFGSRNVAIVAALVAATMILAYRVFDNLPAWFLIRLIQGMAIAVLFVLSESWIVGAAGKKNRGKTVAIYAAVLSASFGAGPALIGVIGIEGWMPFIIGAIVIMLGIIPFFFIEERGSHEPEETRATSLLRFAGKAPVLLGAVAAFAVFDAATLSLFPVYGMKNGLDVATSAYVLTAMILGNTVLQLPIGWLADRFPERLVMAGCATLATTGLLTMPMVIGTPWMWPVLVVVGTTGYGVYTVALASLGNRFSGLELVAGTSSFAVVWGLGALIGSISGGWALLMFDSHGLPLGLAIIYTALVLGVLLRQITMPKTESA